MAVSQKLIDLVKLKEEFVNMVKYAINWFEGAREAYIKENGENYQSAIYDNKNFTDYLLEYVLTNTPKKEQKAQKPKEDMNFISGKITFKGVDKNTNLYLYVETSEGNRIFAPQKLSERVSNFEKLNVGDDVMFIIEKNKKDKGYIAKKVSKPINAG